MSEKELGHIAHTRKADNLGIFDSIQRPLKIVYLGSGSGFFRNLYKDVLNIPGAERGEIALVDVNRERLDLSTGVAEAINREMGVGEGWKITATTERREVLEGADYVINSIEVFGLQSVELDYRIALKYGVDQCIGDTIGPGGLMKAMRTVPVWVDIVRDVEEMCPDAWVLNYTNPMSIMCLAAARTSKANVLGLCHSVQGTSHKLAGYAEVPYREMKWECGGINHLAWFTELSHGGRDLYPAIRKRVMEEDEFIENDPVRLDMMMHFDYFVTESSGHFSEYLPYYRKRPELIKEYCREGFKGESGFYSRDWPGWCGATDEKARDIISGKRKPSTERSWEYASFIIEAMETNQPFVAHTTIPNEGLIDNLPFDGVVEVSTLCDGLGARGVKFGKLPKQCAALCDWHMRMYDIAADAAVNRSVEQAAHALMLDPLTAAVCTPREIKSMVEELFEAEKDYLPGF